MSLRLGINTWNDAQTFSQPPVIGSGSVVLTDAAGKVLSASLNTVAVLNGGTGATDAATARTNLGAAASGSNSDITALNSLSTAITVLQGGTGATTAAGARSALGAASSGANSDITSIASLSTPLTVGQGGTGSSTAGGARTNLGAAASGANSDITSLGSLSTPLSVAQGGTGSGTQNFVDLSTTQATIAGNKTFTGILAAGSGPTTLTNASGTLRAAALDVTLSGSNSGDLTLATVGSTPANAGASLSGQALTLQPADGTHGGVIAASGSQTLAPAFTFSGAQIFSSTVQLKGTTTVGVLGVDNAHSATDFSMLGSNAVAGGTNDLTGSSITIATGQNVGQGVTSIIFQTGTRAGSSGNSLQALQEIARITSFDASLSNKGFVCTGGIRVTAASTFSGGLTSSGSVTIANGGQLYFSSSTSGNNKIYCVGNKALGLTIGDDSTTNNIITIDTTTNACKVNLLKAVTRNGQGGIAAAGSTQGTATALSVEADCYRVTSATVATTFGVILPASVAGLIKHVTNRSGTAITIYPPTSSDIDNAAVNVGYVLANNARVSFHCETTTQWNSFGLNTSV